MAVPDSVVAAGTPEGSSSQVALPEDAWDVLGLGKSDTINEKDWQLKNGQAAMWSGADFIMERKNFQTEQREAYRMQWQQEAEARIAKVEAKRHPLEKAAEGGQLKTQKFTWSKDGSKSFEWRKIYHALVGGHFGLPEGGVACEQLIAPTQLRMYTDHRVQSMIVFPGVSHVSIMAATGTVGFPSPGGLANDWHMAIKEVLFERPYIVSSGAELIAAIQAGEDPTLVQTNQERGMQAAMLPVGVPMTYCRSTATSKDRGTIKCTPIWSKD